MYNTERDSVIGHLAAADRVWLEAALGDTTVLQRRGVALRALIQLWNQGGRIAAQAGTLREAVKDDSRLAEEAAKGTASFEPNAAFKKMERDKRRRQYIREGRERQRLSGWTEWRAQLSADPTTAFSPANLRATLDNLHKWLSMRSSSRSHYNVWDRHALAQAFGLDIARRAEEAFQSFWRAERPTLWSRRPIEERNSTPWAWIYGLCGVAAEATSPGWAAKLTPSEAQLAVAYSTVELNGFSSWLVDLAAAQSAEVDAVLGNELIVELAMGAEHQHLPTLENLTYADTAVKRLLAPRLLEALSIWPPALVDDEQRQRWAYHLDHVITILDETSSNLERSTLASGCEKRFAAHPAGPYALVWLRGLFRFDSEQGTQALESGLAATDDPVRMERAIEILAALFGDRNGVLLDIENPSTRAAILGRLIRCAYNYVRRADDQKHEHVYTPNTRDHAETARDLLFSALLDTRGPDARNVLLQLAEEPLFAHIPDRLRLLARHRAASDAEFEPYNPSALVLLEGRVEAPPHDRDGLFEVMVDRLDDLSHNIAHDDFTDRRTLRTIKEETEMQRTLAWRLKAMAKGAYVITREEEVADLKRTDIRLAAVRGDQKAAIEVKIADQRWLVTDFERALRNQLVGQYLRHENSKAGCLLLTYNGTKSYWKHPETGARLGFQEVVDYLAGVAKGIERDMTHEVRLTVCGLDLTDPILAPAHR